MACGGPAKATRTKQGLRKYLQRRTAVHRVRTAHHRSVVEGAVQRMRVRVRVRVHVRGREERQHVANHVRPRIVRASTARSPVLTIDRKGEPDHGWWYNNQTQTKPKKKISTNTTTGDDDAYVTRMVVVTPGRTTTRFIIGSGGVAKAAGGLRRISHFYSSIFPICAVVVFDRRVWIG